MGQTCEVRVWLNDHDILKQRVRVLGSTSECERVVGCETQQAYAGSLS